MQYSVVSLDRLIHNASGQKGLPPQSFCERGVIALSIQDTKDAGLFVTQPVLVTYANGEKGGRTHATVACVWPLSRVGDGFAALDKSSILSLGIKESDVLSKVMPRATTPRKEAPRRSTPRSGSGKKKKRQQKSVEGAAEKVPSQNNSEQVFTVRVTKLRNVESIVAARAVEIEFPDQAPAVVNCDEYVAMVRRCLEDRLIVQGMSFSTSVLGKATNAQIAGLTRAGSASPEEENAMDPLRFTRKTRVRIGAETSIAVARKNVVTANSVGGLRSEMATVLGLAREVLQSNLGSNSMSTPEGQSDVGQGKLPLSTQARGVLLHGNPGTGKTLLAKAVASACNAHLEIVHGAAIFADVRDDPAQALAAVFERAQENEPSVVILDDVDAVACRQDIIVNERYYSEKLTFTLLSLFDGLRDSLACRVFVIGTTCRPDVIDSALRRPGRFDREVEIPIPDADRRYDILQRLCQPAIDSNRLDASNDDVRNIANVAYGFVGADLAAVWRESALIAIRRGAESERVTRDDLRQGLQKVKPSALREIALEIPAVRWADVGGKEHVKQRLQEAIEWPLTERGAKLFKAIGVEPPRGILLYGPPGCSKTLLAKAVATESGANFLSVKGPELLSKWVGESEKAVREMFRRARQAAPCVIFFDEIDALAASRSGSSGSSAQSRVVAQLLTEMDGIDTRHTFDAQSRVVVIAATNRPDLLDSALLRPGRIDIQVHIDLPDAEERLAILRVHTRRTPLAPDVDLHALASDAVTGGMSGAEVAVLVREAALAAMEADVQNANQVCKSHFDAALTRVTPRTPKETVRFFEEYKARIAKKAGLLG